MSDDVAGFDPYSAVLADLQRRRDEIDGAIQAIQIVRGASATFTPGPVAVVTDSAPMSLNESGQFLGMSISEAAKKFLSAKRRTMNSADLATALQSGGLALTSNDPANTIGSVLTRRFNTVGDIVRVSRGQWGLREWYPHTSFQRKNDKRRDAAREEGGNGEPVPELISTPLDGGANEPMDASLRATGRGIPPYHGRIEE